MANASSTVSDGTTATAAQYNNLRTDAVGPYGDQRVFPDNIALKFGTGEDATIQYDGTNLLINPRAVGSGNVVISSSTVFIGDSANANMTAGLTINQGAADDHIISLKQSNTAHGMTTLVETDTYGAIKDIAADAGGLQIQGYAEGGVGFRASGSITTEDTTDTTASTAGVELVAALKSGTTVTALGATGNVLSIENNGTVVMLVKGNGDIHGADTDGATALDSYDDAALVRTLETHSSRKGVIRDQWDDFVKYNEQDLIDAGLYSAPRSEGGLLNISQLLRLQSGAIWQQAKRIMALEQKLLSLPAGE